jgi:hypothetical protein
MLMLDPASPMRFGTQLTAGELTGVKRPVPSDESHVKEKTVSVGPLMGTLEHAPAEDAPAREKGVLPGHAVQDADPAAEYCPAAQGVQLVPEPNCPARHANR